MRRVFCTVVTMIGMATHPASAQGDHASTTFWKTVQARCDATAAKPPTALGQRIAQTAIDEFVSFGGHQIDTNGRLFHFGLTEAEHEGDGGSRPETLGQLGWWHVMKYWRVLYENDATSKLEVRGYRDASASAEGTMATKLLRTSAAELVRAAGVESDPVLREILRESAMRAAVVDTPWSAAFISFVVRQADVKSNMFQFGNAHSGYIYDAFAVSLAETTNDAGSEIFRACPISTTRPHVGDLICNQREPAFANTSDDEVRDRIRGELAGSKNARTVRRTHCEVIARIDAPARKMYVIGGNVAQSVTARKLHLRRDMKFSPAQTRQCGGSGHWALPEPSSGSQRTPGIPDRCSLNDMKWFVLLQLR